MKYSLRSLMIVVMVGPALVAAFAFAWRRTPIHSELRLQVDLVAIAGAVLCAICGVVISRQDRDPQMLWFSVACLLVLAGLIIDLCSP